MFYVGLIAAMILGNVGWARVIRGKSRIAAMLMYVWSLGEAGLNGVRRGAMACAVYLLGYWVWTHHPTSFSWAVEAIPRRLALARESVVNVGWAVEAVGGYTWALPAYGFETAGGALPLILCLLVIFS